MTRLLAVGLVVFSSIAGLGSVARAEGSLPSGGMITFDEFSIQDEDGAFFKPDLDPARLYFNRAHCTCAKNKAGKQTDVRFTVKLSVSTDPDTYVGDIWVGDGCGVDAQTRLMSCRELTDKRFGDLNALTTPDPLTVNLFDVINGKDEMGDCRELEGEASVWVLADKGDDDMYEYIINEAIGPSGMTKVDTKPPPLPINRKAVPGEDAIVLTWDLPEGRSEDLYSYQALCSHIDDAKVFEKPVKPARYQTTNEVCQIPEVFTFEVSNITLEDEMEVAEASASFKSLDENFICGEASTGQKSLTITGLENGTPYKVALLAIDQHGNVVGTFYNKTVTPRPVTDFWEDLNDRNPGIEGGCLLAKTYGDGNPLTQTLRDFRDGTLARTPVGRWLIDAYYATLGKLSVESLPARIIAGIALMPLVAIALLWHLLTLPGLLGLAALPWLWRRLRALLARRLVRAGMAAAVSLTVVAPSVASADDFLPYWEDPSSDVEKSVDGVGDVRWMVGIRVGPYIPDIDLQFSQNAMTGLGPYEAMFGTYYTVNGQDAAGNDTYAEHKRHVWQVLPMLDVDRVLWRGFGQLTVGGSIGYMQKSAYPYLDTSTEDMKQRPRSTSGKHTFRLIPAAATVSYRFTYLDDRWGIPVVPYLRGGLSYYMWWMTEPTEGKVSRVDGDKARGGSLGFQGSAGIAIRAERIDAAAARSMRNSGIYHAGFYGEVFWAKVDGFGSETKLAVGDTTWFAGVNFEF